MEKSVRKVGRILVEVDIHGGLSKEIVIEWRDRHFSQWLDYLGVPFRCSWCRGTGHLCRDCTGKVPEEKNEDSILQEDPPITLMKRTPLAMVRYTTDPR
jgi:hypothetical protein